MFNRRSMIHSLGYLLGALAARPTLALGASDNGSQAATPAGTPFTRQLVLDAARGLAARDFVKPAPVPPSLRNLDYDTYRQIRYRKGQAIWGSTPTAFSVELFAPGFLFENGVDISVVENGRSYPVRIGADSFDTPDLGISDLLVQAAQFAGFRLHHPLNRDDYQDEFVLFQGASYFRGVSRGQNYGLSARGLAIDVGEATGEEFPIFRRFWIERPSAGATAIVVHALLDSPRVAGAYRFGINPGAPTTMDVDATLFARAPLSHVGLGALTSMFMHGPVDEPDAPDYRPAVHDSVGLAIHTGAGERLWRPLQNPATLQISAFLDTNPRGFGLVQRNRRYEEFQDLEAAYETRPSAWVTPHGDWGPGHVQLVEIPSDSEINDNIVAYWRPANAIVPDTPYPFAYRLTWPNDAPTRTGGLARVIRSAHGMALQTGHPQYVIDYALPKDRSADSIRANVAVSQGKLIDEVVQPNPATGGFRVFVTIDPQQAEQIELSVRPFDESGPVGETWLYRWSRA